MRRGAESRLGRLRGPCYTMPAVALPRRAPFVAARRILEVTPLTVYLNIIQILVSLALIALTILQRKGGGLGSIGGDSSIYRTRRGVEKSLHNLTIILAIVFGLTSVLSVILE